MLSQAEYHARPYYRKLALLVCPLPFKVYMFRYEL